MYSVINEMLFRIHSNKTFAFNFSSLLDYFYELNVKFVCDSEVI